MAEERLKIIIGGDSTGAVTAAQKVQKAFKNMLGVVGAGFLAGGGFAIAQKGFQLFERGVQLAVDALKDSIIEAGKEQETIVKLNAVLKATGVYTEDYSQALIENSKALMNKTTYTDEDIRSVEAQLAVYKLSKQEILEATEVTADMAATMGVDLGSAAKLVGKAMEGITTSLRRYGIILDNERVKTEGSSYVLEVLKGRFEGVAEAQANTAEGLKTRFGNQIGELKETIGAAFLPTIEKLISTFLNGTPTVDGFGNAVGNTTSPLERLQNFIKEVADKIKILLDIMTSADYTTVKEGFIGISDAISVLAGNQGVGGLTSKYQILVDWIGQVIGGLQQSLLVIGINVEIIVLLGKAIGEVIQSLITWNTLVIYGKAALEGNQEAIAKVTHEVEQWHKSNKSVEGTINKLIGTTKAFTESLNNIPREITTTINTIYTSEYLTSGVNPQAPLLHKQSGGISRFDSYIPDLEMFTKKGEGIIPAYVMRAIKENRGSFAGLDTKGGSSVANYFNISSLVVREEADVEKIAQDLYNMQLSSLRGAGIR